MDGSRWLLVLVALAILIAVVQTARLAWRDVAARYRIRARLSRAARGERDAEALLEAHGFAIRGRQVRKELEYRVDGAPCVVEVRADLLAERDGRAWIAEVKTGREAPRITTPATRRQLLEYAHAFEGAGVLLVDAEHGVVSEIALPRAPRSESASWSVVVFALGTALGALVGWMLSTS